MKALCGAFMFLQLQWKLAAAAWNARRKLK
jgi:hypothetical protein